MGEGGQRPDEGGLSEPATKPWGQTVAYLRDNSGFLVEICTPMP